MHLHKASHNPLNEFIINMADPGGNSASNPTTITAACSTGDKYKYSDGIKATYGN